MVYLIIGSACVFCNIGHFQYAARLLLAEQNRKVFINIKNLSNLNRKQLNSEVKWMWFHARI